MIPTSQRLDNGEKKYIYSGVPHEKEDIILANVLFDDSVVLRNIVTSHCRGTLIDRLEIEKGFNAAKKIEIKANKVVGRANV